MFFATDLHASEIAFRKFIGAAELYDVDYLIMGGDVFGKTLTPLVKDSDGSYQFDFGGQKFSRVSEMELLEHESKMQNAGLYPYRVSRAEYEELASRPDRLSELFSKLMLDRLKHWAEIATEHLAPRGIKCYWTGGNDDSQDVLDQVPTTPYFCNVEGTVVHLDEDHEMASLGWSNPTPWKTPRECSEEELFHKLELLTRDLTQTTGSIFNIHPPPFDSNLDIAAKLDASYDPPRPVISGGQEVMIPVGSKAVRAIIEKLRPLLDLCGHIHETKNSAKLGRTLVINPGSEYGSGLLRGVIVNIEKDKVLSFQFTSG